MGSFKIASQRNVRLAVLAALSVATLGQAFMPALVSADQIENRSVALSSTAKAATGVSYDVTFTPAADAEAYVIQFCSNSPVIGSACTAPATMNLNAITTVTGGDLSEDYTATANSIGVDVEMTANTPVKTTLTGVTNPADAGTVFARIVTYETAADAENYTAAAVGDGAVDQGSVAISITDNINVGGVVQESLEFCVSGGDSLATDCAGTDGDLTAPTVQLGETVGSSGKALISSAMSTGSIKTFLSTNASNGAIVSLKSGAAGCGGLILAGKTGATGCFITPATTGAADLQGTAKFGVKLGADIPQSGDNSALTHRGNYGNTNFYIGYNETDESTGVTSVYGDPIFGSAGYANNLPMTLTFGASVAPNTPAGRYSADLSLIATGTF